MQGLLASQVKPDDSHLNQSLINVSIMKIQKSTQKIQETTKKGVEKKHKLPKLNTRYEAFANSILRCNTQHQAAVDAGFGHKTADLQGHRLIRNERVMAYLAYHRALLAVKNKVTLEDVVPTLRQIRDENKVKSPSIAVQACTELAKIGRLYTDQVLADSKPSFIGISINTGDGLVKVGSSDSVPKQINSKTVDVVPSNTKLVDFKRF